MARKFCPKCKLLNGGSARTCMCGYEFAESEIVVPRTTKSCPTCGAEGPLLLQRCGCGHELADIVELRQQLVSRVHLGWSYIVLGVTLLAVSIAITLASSGTWIFVSVGGLILAVRGLFTRADARSALREINAAAGALPSAKIVG